MVGWECAKLPAKLYTAIVHERDNFPISPGHFAIRQYITQNCPNSFTTNVFFKINKDRSRQESTGTEHKS
jgi:hypothetical protein